MGRLLSRRCRYCQEEIADTDKECPHCGEKFPENEPPIGARTSRAYHKGMSYAAGTSSLDGDKKEKKEYCFIATAAYGTPYSKEIDYLKAWRDLSLSNKKGGTHFIYLYYRISPPFARLISKSEFLRTTVRMGLYPVIHHFKKNSG